MSISTLTTPFNAVEQVLVNVIRKKRKKIQNSLREDADCFYLQTT